MSARTYVPTLLFLLKGVCQFITKHRDRILEVIGSTNTNKLDAIIVACDAFTAIALPFLDDGV